MPKMNVNAFFQKDYENETVLRPKKTNPNKANLKKNECKPFVLQDIMRVNPHSQSESQAK